MTRQNASDIASHLRQLIENQTYRVADRLPPSRQLAHSFGAARNTVRDALRKLETQGLIQTRPGSGAYVTASALTPTPNALAQATPLELIDARFALEPHVCRLCVLHARSEDLDTLDKLCSQMERSVHDPLAFANSDMMFHKALASATRNALLVWLVEQITAVRTFDEWNRMRQLTLDQRTICTYNSQHRAVLDAIKVRDAELAANRMKHHLETARLSLTRIAQA